MNNTSANKQQYKYRLKELFIAYFGCKSGDMRKEFCRLHNLSRCTVSNDFNLLLGDPTPIPTERLKAYAEFLNTYPEQLKNRLHQTLAA